MSIPEQWTGIRGIRSLEKAGDAGEGRRRRCQGAADRISRSRRRRERRCRTRQRDRNHVAVCTRREGASEGLPQGTNLKSADFDGDTKTKDIDVASTPGEQRVDFDFSIQQPSPTQAIRVADVYGREAQALVTPDPGAIGPMKGSEEIMKSIRAHASRGRRPLADSPIASAALRAGTTRPRLRGPAMRVAVAPSYRGEVARAADQRADQRDRRGRIDVRAGKC